MYRWLRNVHLAGGLFTAAFLLAYALSAAQMAYPTIYNLGSRETSTTVEVPAGFQVNPRAFAWWLMEHHDLRGNLTEVRTDNAGVQLTLVRPGTTHHVTYDPRSGSARVTTRTLDAIGMLNRLHHTHGTAHDYWAINAWGWLLFVVSLVLLLLAVTGIVMWFQRHEDRWLGAIVLAGGLAWGGLLIAIRLA